MNDFISLLAVQGPALVFVVTLATRLGAPLPAVPFLVIAGGLTVGGQVSIVALTVAGVLGNIVGDGAWFIAGRRWGYRVMRVLCRISLSADSCVKRSESIIGRWGGLSLLASKFLPGVSVVAPAMAGALRMSNIRFLWYETVGALVWTLGFLMVGRIFHAAIRDVVAVMSSIGLTATAIGALLLGAFVLWRYRQRRMALRTEGIARIEVDALRAALAAGAGLTLIDVRSDEARGLDSRAIPGAIGIGLGQLPHRLDVFRDGRELIVFCDCPDDGGALHAARILTGAGLQRVRVLAGGLDAWVASSAAGQAAADVAMVAARPA